MKNECKVCKVLKYYTNELIAKHHISNCAKLRGIEAARTCLMTLHVANIIKANEEVKKSFYKYGKYKVEVLNAEINQFLKEDI